MTTVEVKIVRVGDPPPLAGIKASAFYPVNIDHLFVLEKGTEGSKASVAIVAKLPDGSVAFIETTADLFMTMADAVRGGCRQWGEAV